MLQQDQGTAVQSGLGPYFELKTYDFLTPVQLYFSHSFVQLPMIARVSRILLPKGSKSAQGLLVVTKYDVGEALHPHYHMPILLPDTAACRVIVPSEVSLPDVAAGFILTSLQSIQFTFNVQHDCRACGCDASGITRQMQERHESDTLIHSIVHKDDVRFIINMHGFHNAGLLRKYLPIALTKPRPLFLNRRQRHDELAGILAVTQKEKRAATQQKAAATREKNKAAKSAGTDTRSTDTTTSAAEVRDSGGAQKRPRIE